MKIQKVEAYMLQGLLGKKAFGWSQGVANRRQTALGLVSTDSGIQGVGEAFYYGFSQTRLKTSACTLKKAAVALSFDLRVGKEGRPFPFEGHDDCFSAFLVKLLNGRFRIERRMPGGQDVIEIEKGIIQ